MSTGVASECQTVEPMRAPLTLSTLDPETPQQFTEVLNVLRSVVGQNLFLWETFPIHLPESISNAFDNSVGSIFNAPDFDECEILSKDGRGNLKPLNRYQLAQLRQSGEFDVESANFIGEAHTWRISSFFLKGTRHIRQTFLKDLDAALSWLVITAHDRVVGHQFSVKNGISALYTHFFRMLIDLFFGWPYVNHGDVDRKLMEERLRFITCELSVKSSQRKRVMDFWDFYEQLMCCPRDTPVEQLNLKYSPYRFVTPSRIPIDLRLHNSALLDRCLAVIHDLRQSTRAGWFQDFKERSISRFRGEGKSIADIKRLVRNDGLREYAKRLFEAMRQNITLQSVGHGIVEPLIQQASFSIILAEAKEEFMLAWLAYRENAEKELRKQHCILYRIEEWRFRRMARIQRDYFEAHMFDVHEYVLAKCTEANLEQHAFFISRDLVFLKEREKLLRDQLEKSASFPDTQFIFQVPAQLLRHWRVYRKNISYTTSYDLVDTILLSRRPSSKDQVPLIKRSIKKVVGHENPYAVVQTAYQQRRPPTTEQELGPQDFEVHAAASPKCIYDGSSTTCVGNQDVEDTNKGAEPVFGCDVTPTVRRAQPEYVVQSKLVYKASTRYFLWRWLVFFVCTYTWLLRTGQLFFIIIPFRSAFSLTALFKPTPIYLKLDLDQSTGYLFYNRTFYQDTLISRLCRIWRNIRASRIAFDATPSKGLLDKAAARPLHRVWSYVFRGFLTSLILILVWPPLCLIVSFTSLLLGLCIPFVIPLVSLILHFLGILFWDAYKPATRSNRLFPLFEVIINHFLLRFLFQTIFAFLTGFFVCPILAVLHVFWAIVRCVSRSIWDALIFHLVLRRLARVPAREDFMVKRIAGPGTAANSFYEAHPVDVLIILICQLELLELRLWRRQMEALADKPIELYQRLVKGLSWLSVTPQVDGSVYTSLCRHTKSWHSSIQYKADERLRDLQLNLKANQLHRIKLSDRDLRLTLRMGSELTEYFYQHRISPRLAELKQVPLNWWSTFGLGVDDYLGLCTNLLGKTFGEQFFTCIMETDTVFPLQVNEPSIGRHFEEFLGRMVRKRPMVENRSLPSLTPSRDRVEREDRLNERTCVPVSHCIPATSTDNDDELLSLASDAIASSADIISQRCTVIAASSKRDPERRIPSVEQHSGLIEMGSVGKLDITDRETAVSFALPADLRGTQQRSVPDPIAFIHIDLPLFPLSAFTPSSNRYLPLPLKSSPKIPMYPCLCGMDVSDLESRCACCICPTKDKLERKSRAKLAEKWGKSIPSSNACLHDFACVEHEGDNLNCPVCTGFAALLFEDEHELRRQLSGLTVDSQHRSQRLTASFTNPVTSPTTSPSHNKRGPPVLSRPHRPTVWEELFGSDLSHRACGHKMPILNIVGHLGRVYHPAIVTLLMHARDREPSPLDFTHPAIQMAVNRTTMPQKEFSLLRRIRQHVTDRPINEDDLRALRSGQLGVSMGSEIAKELQACRADKISSLRGTTHLSVDQLRRRRVMSANASLRNSVAFMSSEKMTRSLWIEGEKDVLKPEKTGSSQEIGVAQTGTDLRHPSKDTPNRSARNGGRPMAESAVGDHRPGEASMLLGWDATNPMVSDYWSGMNTPGYDTYDRDYSVGTPSASLYGTEDAATTDDVDESDDALSMASIDQCQFMENFLAAAVSGDTTAVTPTGVFTNSGERPKCLPLAIPELLTTSATTASSTEVGNPVEDEDDNECLRLQNVTPAGSVSTPSIPISGPNSTVVTPGSCDAVRIPQGSPVPSVGSHTGTVASVNSALRRPDLLADMIQSSQENFAVTSEYHPPGDQQTARKKSATVISSDRSPAASLKSNLVTGDEANQMV